ncbi:uncharacterized protein LOC135828954 [Sycon ciliatum]|uniref:uncharacterized protein LOC135828954 n=1 Tax=Sycon ciliatum TaxID=27933 RepID=UPI0020ACE27D
MAFQLAILFAVLGLALASASWNDCDDGKTQIYTSQAISDWIGTEKHCQTKGAHLISHEQAQACHRHITNQTYAYPDGRYVNIGSTRLVDAPHFRAVGNNLKVDNFLPVHIAEPYFKRYNVLSCAKSTVTGNRKSSVYCQLDDLTWWHGGPERYAPGPTHFPMVCARKKGESPVNSTCVANGQTGIYLYHTIAFGFEHALEACKLHGGRPILSLGDERACTVKLLTESTILRDNDVSGVELFTNDTTLESGKRFCQYFKVSTNTVVRYECNLNKPVVCVSSKAPSADSGALPEPSLGVEEDAAPSTDSEAPIAEEVSQSQGTSAKGPLFSSGVVECKGYRLQLHREENTFDVSASTCAQSGMRLFRRKYRKALKESKCFQKLLGTNQGLLVWMRVKKSKTATMDLSTGEDGPEQSRAASLCVLKPART